MQIQAGVATCLPPRELVPLDGAPADQPTMYFLEVPDAASVYDYRIEVTSVDGSLLGRNGEIATIGNRLGGETCRPTMFGAQVPIDQNGQVTIQQPPNSASRRATPPMATVPRLRSYWRSPD